MIDTGNMGPDEIDSEKMRLLEEFEKGRLPLLEFMRSVKRLEDSVGGLSVDPRLGKAVVASFGRHTEGRDLMATILKIFGFGIELADRDASIPEIIDMCQMDDVSVLCLSVQTTYDCPGLEEIDGTLRDLGIRDRIVFNVGGAAVSEHLAKKLGCDIYGRTASESVRVMREAVLNKYKG